MGNYSVIAETGERLVRILRRQLVPDLILTEQEIALCEPHEKNDIRVKVCLYNVEESQEVRMNGMVNQMTETQKYPPLYLSLYYMITVFSYSDIKYRAVEEHRVIGKIMQILHDYPMNPTKIESSEEGERLRVELLNVSMEEKLRAWNYPNTPYKLSLFYKVVLVELESAISRSMKRVTDFTVKLQG